MKKILILIILTLGVYPVFESGNWRIAGSKASAQAYESEGYEEYSNYTEELEANGLNVYEENGTISPPDLDGFFLDGVLSHVYDSNGYEIMTLFSPYSDAGGYVAGEYYTIYSENNGEGNDSNGGSNTDGGDGGYNYGYYGGTDDSDTYYPEFIWDDEGYEPNFGPPTLQQINAAQLITVLNLQSSDTMRRNYIRDAANANAVENMLNYLSANGGNTTDNLAFITWAIDYLVENQGTVSFEEFKSSFLYPVAEGKDGIDDFDASYWNDPNLIITPQILPSYDAFLLAYPKKNYGTLQFEMDAGDVFDLVGGTPKSLRDATLSDNTSANDRVYSNACALRVSRALNYSGVTIPEVSGTYKGEDGKNYFLSAASLNAWMEKAFPPTSTNSIRLTNSDAGINGAGFEKKLNGLKGIYILIPNYPGNSYFGASGHAGIFTTPPLTHYYFTAKGGVAKITLWKLN